MNKFEKHIKRMKGLRDVYEVGTGQHNILSMLINECEAALRQPPVSGSVCAHKNKKESAFMSTHWYCSDCNMMLNKQNVR